MNKEELKLVIANNIQKGWVSYGDFRTDVAIDAIVEALTKQLRIGAVSQQRELLIAYNVEFYKGLHDVTLKQIEGHVDKYLSNL
ncbi:hypothetical protein [Tenacibaculum dicentrarchi]|uniref:hypothetical protein n=1 Tax=Tenacibaculum dicentrarchi TaxID=669041 RepID=UPI00351475F1